MHLSNDFYDDAQMHRVSRHFEVQNIEVNLIKFPLTSCSGPCGVTCGNGSCGMGGGAGFGAGAGYGGAGYGGGNRFNGMYGNAGFGSNSRLSIVGTAGVRYMRIDEWIDFDTDDADITFGNSADELFYDVETENHLIGFQLGAAANYQATCNFSLYCDGKFGIYGNHIQHTSNIFGQGGFATVAAGLPYAGQNFDIKSTKNDVAFVGELRLGGAYNFRPNWRLYGGYRVIALTGLALPTNQLPANFADTLGVSEVKSNGSMILHGLQAGIEFAF